MEDGHVLIGTRVLSAGLRRLGPEQYSFQTLEHWIQVIPRLEQASIRGI
jgi:hypothetical protein